MDFVFPCKYNRVITAPLNILGRCLCFRVILAKLVLKVATDNPNLPVFSEQGNETAIGRNRDVLEGAILEHSILSIGGVDNVDRLVDCQ